MVVFLAIFVAFALASWIALALATAVMADGKGHAGWEYLGHGLRKPVFALIKARRLPPLPAKHPAKPPVTGNAGQLPLA